MKKSHYISLASISLYSFLLIAIFFGYAQEVNAAGNGYLYSRTITLDHTKVSTVDSTNLTDFPVLISGTFSYLKTLANGGKVANANGYDIAFTSDSGCVTKLDWETEIYTATTGRVEAWVRIPTLSASTDTVIYLCYGKSSISTSQSNANGVWDSDYQGVYHLPNGSALSVLDSSGNTSPINNGVTATAGKIDGAGNFATTSQQYIQLDTGSGATDLTDHLTLQAWVNPSFLPTNDGLYYGIITKGYDGSATQYQLDFQNDAGTGNVPQLLFQSYDGTGHGPAYTYGSNITVNNWYHIVGARDGTNWYIYVNGVEVASTTDAAAPAHSSKATLLGAFDIQGFPSIFYFPGKLDEARISSSARSPDWIKTEYNHQNSTSTFQAFGSEVEAPPEALAITLATSSPSLTSVAIRWTTNNAADSQVEYSLTPGGPYTATAVTDVSGVTSHTVVIPSLSEQTTYYYRVRSIDTNDDSEVSSERSITTTISSPILSGNISTTTIQRFNDQYPVKYNKMDTFNPVWAADDNLYTPSDDTWGWNNDLPSGRNMQISRVTGTTYITDGVTINSMDEYGGLAEYDPADCNVWKADGMTTADEVLYLAISRHRYGLTGCADTGDQTNYYQLVSNSSIIKSVDYGATWVNASGTADSAPALNAPMFPGPKFGAPYFVNYGKNGAVTGDVDNSDMYVYALSPNDSDFHSDEIRMGRVRKSLIADLDASDWEFYTGGDGMLDSSWGTLDEATPIISKTDDLAMAGVQYNPILKRYILAEWDWVNRNIHNSEWDFYESPTPWGPWTSFYTITWPQAVTNGYPNFYGAYSPTINPKSFSADGLNMILMTSGDYSTAGQGPETTQYSLYQMRFDIVTAPSAPRTLAGTAGDTQVSLSWLVPTENGGSGLTNYSVWYKLAAGSTYARFATTSASTTASIVTGLSSGTAYDFKVYAHNSYGTSTAATESVTLASDSSPTPTPDNSSPAVPVSVGGFGGGSTATQAANLRAMNMYNQPIYGPNAPSAPLPKLASPFGRTLRLGMTGLDVKALQIFLNSHVFTVAPSGPGSPGRETSFFGYATRAAVMKLQEAYKNQVLWPLGLSAPTGIFGPSTIRLVDGFLGY